MRTNIRKLFMTQSHSRAKARGILLNDNNEILLVRHHPQAKWCLSGGHIE